MAEQATILQRTSRKMQGVGDHLLAGVRWCASHLWFWPVTGIGAPVFYGLGVTAMFANQYIIAAIFYFIAITWLTARSAAEARSHAEKGGVIFIIIALGSLLFGGSLLWIRTAPALPVAQIEASSPSRWSSLIESLSGWFSQFTVYLAALPWRWIAPSFAAGGSAIGILLFLRQRRLRAQERKLLCPNQDLHKFVEADQKQIHHWFRITSVGYQTHFGDVPFIEFYFSAYNMAVVPVSVDDSIDGRIVFYKNRQDRELDLKWEATIKGSMPKNCQFRNACHFIIRQDVTPHEANFIERQGDDSYFFVGLKITISGDGFSKVQLGGNFSIPKNGYFPGDHPAAIFGGDDALWRDREDALLKEKSASTTERDKLKADLEKEKRRSDILHSLGEMYGKGIQLFDHLIYGDKSDLKSIGVWLVSLESRIEDKLGGAALVRFRDGSVRSLVIPDSLQEQRSWVSDQNEKLSKIIENILEPEWTPQTILIKVKSTSKQELDGGERTGFWERNKAHPGGEIWVTGDNPIEVAETLKVIEAIQGGRIIQVQ